MKFQCPGCQAGFVVPDEKIPSGKGIRVLCPQCRLPIEFKGNPSNGQEEAQGQGRASSDGELAQIQEEMSLIDMVDGDVKTALICVSDEIRAEKTRNAAIQMGYYTVVASKASFAIKKLQNNHYDLIILDERFDSSKPSENLFLHHLQLVPMHVRRNFFLCLLSDQKPTLDHMLAFQNGVDLIFSTADLDKMKVILTRAIKDHEGLYKVFADELGRKGQR
ncbi:MAG: hypothetical protein GX443_02695 [Deltaproteobacteria bacterium]|nr:hypothetical protein [Deltaproteobacteria bacterium]